MIFVDDTLSLLADLLDQDQPWRARAKCKGAPIAVMFPRPWASDGSAATALCAKCPVREECLEYALERNIDHGIWGGESARERRKIRRQRRAA